MKENTVVVLMGLPLAGKTTLGNMLSKRTGAHYLDIDKAAECAPPQEENPHRSDEARARERKRMAVAYTILHAAVTANLKAGWPIIISATYSRRSNQELLRRAIEEGGGNLKIIWCEFDERQHPLRDPLICDAHSFSIPNATKFRCFAVIVFHCFSKHALSLCRIHSSSCLKVDRVSAT